MENYKETDQQLHGFLIGSLLGDGCFLKKTENHNTYITFSQCAVQLDYLGWKYEFLQSKGLIKDKKDIKLINPKTRGTQFENAQNQYKFSVASNPLLNWYKNEQKYKIIEDLNEMGLPLPLTLMLSMGVGFGTSYGLNKLAFIDSIRLEKAANDELLTYVSDEDLAKINSWKYRPDDGFLEGTKVTETIPEGTIFKRYGSPDGSFLGNTTDSFESRAMAPYSDPSINDVEEHFYRLNKDYEMTTGKAAPWFNSSGGAEQFVVYKTNGKTYSINELIKLKVLVEIK